MEKQLTPKRVSALRSELGLDKKAFGEQLGVTRQTVLGWEEGKHEPKGASRLLLMQLLTKVERRKVKR